MTVRGGGQVKVEDRWRRWTGRDGGQMEEDR